MALNPETAIQIGIMNFLRRIMALEDCRRFMAFHVPNGGRRGPKEAALLQDMGVMPGVADLVILMPGQKTLFIELKRQKMRSTKRRMNGIPKYALVRGEKGVQEDVQKIFEHRVSKLGFDYRLIQATDAADGLRQVLAIMAEYGVKF